MKITEDIIILLMCTKNYNHMMYDSWDTEWDRQNFCHFRSFSALSPPYRPGKSKFWEIEKNTWRYYHFILMYGSWDMERNWHNFLSFWVIFGPFTPLTIDAEPKFWKIKKNTWRYNQSTHVYQKLWSHNVQFLRYGARRTDGRTDKRTDWKSDIKMWCPT